MLLVCEICDANCFNVIQWLEHLLSNEHQQVIQHNIHQWSPRMLDRTVVALHFGNVDRTDYLLTRVSRFSFVHDLSIRSCKTPTGERTTVWVVLMDSKQDTDYFMHSNSNDDPKYGIKFARRNDLSPAMWEALTRNEEAVVGFRNRHQKLISSLKEKCLSLDEQLLEFIKEMSLDNAGFENRKQFLNVLESSIKREFSTCSIIPFGSFHTGIGDNNADIDIFVEVKDKYKLDDMHTFKRTLMRLRNENQKGIFKKFSPIRNTRVPIIKVIHSATGVEADISFNSVLSTYNSKLIKFYIDFDPRVRPLLIIIRYWGRYHNLSIGCDKIKPYALVLMTIVFLQKQQIIPNIYNLQNVPGEVMERHFVKNWNVAFANDVALVRSKFPHIPWDAEMIGERGVTCEVILKLAKDFFQMYGGLSFPQYIISPLLGAAVKKEEIKQINVLKWGHIFKTGQYITIQNLFVLDHNVGVNVSLNVVNKFQFLCRSTAKTLEDMLGRINNNVIQSQSSEFIDIFVDYESPLISWSEIWKNEPVFIRRVPNRGNARFISH